MISVAITNYNYGRYLGMAIESALAFTDDVTVYDDCSTDASREVAEMYSVPFIVNESNSGGPVWGSNLAIEQAKGDYLFYLDADNIMLGVPENLTADYTYCPIPIIDDSNKVIDMWRYDGWPLTAAEAIANYKRTIGMPVPWGGFWRLDFLRSRNLKWEPWPSTDMAADFHTCVRWMLAHPTLAYHPEPCLAFRQHEGQWSASPERDVMLSDARKLASII